jgi:chromosome segregation ATPase
VSLTLLISRTQDGLVQSLKSKYAKQKEKNGLLKEDVRELEAELQAEKDEAQRLQDDVDTKEAAFKRRERQLETDVKLVTQVRLRTLVLHCSVSGLLRDKATVLYI